jgi:CheY-like chemotaxis protein
MTCFVRVVIQFHFRIFMPSTPPSANLSTLNGHVLVVDDGFVNLKMMQSFLRGMGFTVDTALDGALTVTALEKVPYDLVLMDCNMPVLDGFETTRVIRDLSSSVLNHAVPIIAVTADVMPDCPDRCLDAGMDDYISKPVNFKHLKSVLAKWVG